MVSLSSMGAYLQEPNFFDLLVSEQTLNCGIHPCPSKCHQLVDHSKLKCEARVVTECVNNHPVHKECHDKYSLVNCPTCKRQKRQAEDAARRAAEQAAHEEKMAELDARLAAKRLASQGQKVAQERDAALKRKQQDVLDFEAACFAQPSVPDPPAAQSSPIMPINPSSSSSFLSSILSKSKPNSTHDQ